MNQTCGNCAYALKTWNGEKAVYLCNAFHTPDQTLQLDRSDCPD